MTDRHHYVCVAGSVLVEYYFVEIVCMVMVVNSHTIIGINYFQVILRVKANDIFRWGIGNIYRDIKDV